MMMIDYSKPVISITFEQLRNVEIFFEYIKVKVVTVLSLFLLTIFTEPVGCLAETLC